MEDRIQNILKRFPHNICFVHYLVDSIIDGNNGDGCFFVDDIELAFCHNPSEKVFWKQHLLSYRFLFTAALLKFYSNKYVQLQDNYENFVGKYYGKIANESKLFFKEFSPQKTNEIKLVDFLYSEPDFALTLQFNFDDNSSVINDVSSYRISIIKKNNSPRVDNQEGAKEELYGKDYIYVASANGKNEELRYNDIADCKLLSYSMMYTSRLVFATDNFINLKNVISFAKTDKGFIYIIKEGDNNYLRSQGFQQTSRLIKRAKQPIMVKAFSSRVVVLMSDGTLTSNFGKELKGVRKVSFDENGNIKTENL